MDSQLYTLIKKNKLYVIITCTVLLVGYVIVDTVKNLKQATAINTKEIAEGKILAMQYCRSCHSLPDPSLLNKQMWDEGVLPRMGPFLGVVKYHGKPYFRANDVDLSYFPPHSVIDSVQWGKLVKYYLNTAPYQLPDQPNKIAAKTELPFFNVEQPSSKFFYGTTSMTSYIKIDTTVKPHRIIVNDGMAKRFLLVDDHLNLLNGFNTHGPIVDLDFQRDGILATSIGTNLEANNKTNGEIINISINAKAEVKPEAWPTFSKLARPVKITHADLNGDGKVDYIISQFGNLVGDLSWMENRSGGKFIPHVLRKRPGALNTIVYDYNHDGLPDIYAQFAQGDEGIFLYTNKGHGQFEETRLLSFPPSYGSTSFDLVDMNGDGYPDIVYTCGDNADYTPILKPYHGVYIFLNDGYNHFKQKYFYPINGCYKAIALDFDGDGLVDIATISFYPSSAQPLEAFIYLQNKGKLNFQPYALPLNTPFQKGVTMDAGDLDGDGEPDLILGNGYYTSDSTSTHREPLFIVLKNITSAKKNK